MAHCLLQYLQRFITRTQHLWHRAVAFLYTQPTSEFQYLVLTCLMRWAHYHAPVPKPQLFHYEDVATAKLHVRSTILSVAYSVFVTAAQGGAFYVSRIPLPVS